MCDVPLGPYLVMVIVRIVCAYPRASTLSRSAPYDRADPLEPAPAAYFWLTISPPRPDRRNPDAVRAALAQSRHVGTLAIDHRVRRVADLISIYSVVVFVLGNWWVITSTSCAADSPTLYRGAVAALVFSWLYVAEILVWATLVIFFLPFVLVRRLSLGPAQTASSRCSQAEDRPRRADWGALVRLGPEEERGRPAQEGGHREPAAARLHVRHAILPSRLEFSFDDR